MSRKKIDYIEEGERLIGLSKEAMRNVRLWILWDLWVFNDDGASFERAGIKFNSFEDYANYLEDELEGIYDDDRVYEYIRDLYSTKTDKEGYECVTYVRGHRPIELNCDPITWLKNQEVA